MVVCCTGVAACAVGYMEAVGCLDLYSVPHCDWKAVACCGWVTAPVWYNSNTVAGVRVHHRDTGTLLYVGAINDLDSVSSSQVYPALASDSDARSDSEAMLGFCIARESDAMI